MARFTPEPLAGGEAASARRWTDVLGAWLGIGTAPGALIVGAGMAARYGGAVPLLTVFVSLAAMFLVVWLPGVIGVNPPFGEGRKFTDLSPRYFSAGMQRVLAGLIAIGMIGWFGFNVGLGGAALSSLLGMPGYLGPILIGIPVLVFSLLGIKSWNGVAILTTIAVIILVVIITMRYTSGELPVKVSVGNPFLMIVDMAAFLGYVSVFAVRSPDFTAGFQTRKDLLISNLLLCVPIILISLAGVGLYQGTGSTDLVNVMSQPGGLKIGNLLIFLAVVAPALTILYSGAPALRAAVGLDERLSMGLITVIGLTLAITRFDLLLIKYLGILAALLPPVVIPLAVEFTRRRKGKARQMISFWVWLPGALVSMGLTIMGQPLAALFGLITSGLATLVWVLIVDRKVEE